MASPPTVTANGTTLPAGMVVSASISPATQGTAALRILGGTLFTAGALSRVYSATIGATGGNGGTNDGKQCAGWRADIIANAQNVSFRVGPTSAKYRFLVDGQYVDLTGTQTVATTGTTTEYIKLAFASKAVRRITIEGQLSGALSQVWCETGGTLTRPSDTPKRVAFAGDSITYGTAAAALGDNYAWVAADTLGFGHVLSSGAPSTGYAATNGGANYKLSQRLADINGTGPWDAIVVAMGVNDISQGSTGAAVTSEVATCLASFRASNPAAQIFVVGPWDRSAPAAPEAGYSTIKAAIQAGVPAGQGITFLDPEGVAYVNSDGTHPTTAGHATLGAWLAGAIKTALGA
jgi:lysophospholipase L1-like esterase